MFKRKEKVIVVQAPLTSTERYANTMQAAYWTVMLLAAGVLLVSVVRKELDL